MVSKTLLNIELHSIGVNRVIVEHCSGNCRRTSPEQAPIVKFLSAQGRMKNFSISLKVFVARRQMRQSCKFVPQIYSH